MVVRPFRFAIQALALADRMDVVKAARQTEELGYVQLFSYDHIGAVDPFVPLMIAAGAAPTLGVGPLVLNNELHHPALLARTAATVDRLTDGRLVLGLGTGYLQSEHDAIGSPIRPPGPRVRRFAESIQVLRALLDTGAASYDGEFHQLALVDLGVRPTQEHVPFLIGGHGRQVVTIAGRHADVFQFTGLTHGEDGAPAPGGFAIAAVEQRAHWLADAAGDRIDDIERSALVQVTHIGSRADARADELAARYGVDRSLIDDTPFVLVGSIEQVVDKLERLRRDLGVSHLVVRDPVGFAPVVAAIAGR